MAPDGGWVSRVSPWRKNGFIFNFYTHVADKDDNVCCGWQRTTTGFVGATRKNSHRWHLHEIVVFIRHKKMKVWSYSSIIGIFCV